MSLHDTIEADFEAILKEGGESFTYQDDADEITFLAMVSDMKPEDLPFEVIPEDDIYVELQTLKSKFTVKPGTGDYFRDTDNRYRVVNAKIRPRHPIAKFACKVSSI